MKNGDQVFADLNKSENIMSRTCGTRGKLMQNRRRLKDSGHDQVVKKLFRDAKG